MSKVIIAPEAIDFKRGVDFIGVSVSFIVHDGNGNVLLQKRSQQCRDERGMWDAGGGALEFGETWHEGVLREIKEELLAKPLKVKFLTAYEAHRENDGQPTHWIALVHAIHVDPKKVGIGEPHKIDGIGWFTSKTLPSPLHSQIQKSLDIGIKNGYVK